MGLDDLMSTESAVVAGITATVLSPRVRETVRRGAVLGVAGALKAGDVVAGGVRGIGRGIKGGAQTPEQAPEQAPTPVPKPRSSPAKSSASAPNATAR